VRFENGPECCLQPCYRGRQVDKKICLDHDEMRPTWAGFKTAEDASSKIMHWHWHIGVDFGILVFA